MNRFINRILMSVLVLGASMASAGDWPEAEPMSAAQLDAATGRQGVSLQWQLNENEQNALVSGNVLSGDVRTGNNQISDQAFGSMSGIATVIQNTG
ncbi:MAG TPA: hypothetical protein VKY53_00860, partial [Marinobacter sp.]|nr:hypothetical protein [Marinobacter sp.]